MPKVKVGQDIIFNDGGVRTEATITKVINNREIEVLMTNRGYFTNISPKEIVKM